MQNKKLCFLLVFTLYLTLLSQNFLCCDDWRYVVSMETGEPIETLGDAIRSQLFFYMTNTGRFLGHTMMQYFSSMRESGLLLSNIISSCCFTGLCLVLFKYLSKQVQNKSLMAFLLLALLLGIPVPGYNFLGNIAFQINYVWTSFAVFFYFYILQYRIGEKNSCCRILVCIFALVTGSLQESFSIGAVPALACFWWLYRRRIVPYQKSMIVAFWIGAAILILAPGNFQKEDELVNLDVSLAYKVIEGIGQVAVYAKMFSLLCTSLLIYAIRNRKGAMQFVKEHILLFVTALVNALFIILVVINGPHQATCIELCAIVMLVKLFYRLVNQCEFRSRFDPCLRWGSLACIISLLIPIYYYRSQVKSSFEAMIESAKSSTDGVMISTEFDRISYTERNWFVRNYTTTEFNQGTFLDWLSIWLSNGKDSGRITCKLPLPKKEIVALCNESNCVSSNVYHVGGENSFFYIICVPEEADHTTCQLICEQNTLSKMRSFITNTYNPVYSQTVALDTFQHFENEGYCYFIICGYDICPILSVTLI